MFRDIRDAGRTIAPTGMQHFRRGEHRVHLRAGADGRGILTVDASRIIHLNPTATDMAWMLLSDVPQQEALKRLRRRYAVSARKAASDLSAFTETLEGILESGATEPITFLHMEVTEPFRAEVEAPYRMDLALTYRCNVACGHCYNPAREKVELETDGWRNVLRKVRDLGIPHVIFTGGEATLRDDLPELVGFAESLGLVTGLLTNGVRLADGEYLDALLAAGLDHVQVTLESADPEIHNAMTGADSFDRTVRGIQNCLAAGIHTITNTTLTRANAAGIAETLRFAYDLGLRTVAANAVIHSGKALEGDFALEYGRLEPVILSMNEQVEELGMRLIWYSPTRYCRFNPLEFNLGEKRCTAGEYNLCVEPDGEVLPCQSWYESAGNLLTDSWESIWNSPLLRSARERTRADAACRECVHFTLCGGGCPLETDAGSTGGAACFLP